MPNQELCDLCKLFKILLKSAKTNARKSIKKLQKSDELKRVQLQLAESQANISLANRKLEKATVEVHYFLDKLDDTDAEAAFWQKRNQVRGKVKTTKTAPLQPN